MQNLITDIVEFGRRAGAGVSNGAPNSYWLTFLPDLSGRDLILRQQPGLYVHHVITTRTVSRTAARRGAHRRRHTSLRALTQPIYHEFKLTLNVARQYSGEVQCDIQI